MGPPDDGVKEEISSIVSGRNFPGGRSSNTSDPMLSRCRLNTWLPTAWNIGFTW
jgi:hypothetical protein